MTAYRYLLDTNILSDLIKNPAGLVTRKIASADIEQTCCTGLIVACELRYGACKKSSSQLASRVELGRTFFTTTPKH
ncbi:MAG: VapC toxin family PIN domain ribonuclease, partial [Candidatus Electrothrix sp. AUS1_2]|nr:VapC toxin family PIN domain ribonuclease [Candidatus Electrothrix sp. AUS1_2]